MTQTPLCNEAEEFTLTMTEPEGSLPNWITLHKSNQTVVVDTADFSDAGSYKFTLDVTTPGGAATSASF